MIPSPSTLKAKTKASYGQKLGPAADEYLDALFKAVCDGWQSWQDSIKFGGLKANGGGVGAWSGVGSGGSMSGSTYKMASFSFKANSPQQIKFTQGLASALTQKFTPFPTSFKFGAVPFLGTSGASPSSSGPVNAINTPTPLGTAGGGSNPSGIASLWKSTLTPPDFDLGNPQCKSGTFIDAIASAIEQSFQTTWLTTTMITGNSLKTTGKPAGVVAGASTGSDGKLA